MRGPPLPTEPERWLQRPGLGAGRAGAMATRYASRGERIPPIERMESGSPAGAHVLILSDEASVLRRYGVALAANATAYAASLLLWPLIVPNAFALFCAAVMVRAWYSALGPGWMVSWMATIGTLP